MAHRYASKIAENTCAAKRAEVGLRLALLEAREADCTAARAPPYTVLSGTLVSAKTNYDTTHRPHYWH